MTLEYPKSIQMWAGPLLSSLCVIKQVKNGEVSQHQSSVSLDQKRAGREIGLWGMQGVIGQCWEGYAWLCPVWDVTMIQYF